MHLRAFDHMFEVPVQMDVQPLENNMDEDDNVLQIGKRLLVLFTSSQKTVEVSSLYMP